MVYCDTDSIKTLGPVDIDRINGERMKRAKISGGVARDRKGHDHYIGIFEYEGTYDRFVSCGAKRYAYPGFLLLSRNWVAWRISKRV